MPGVPGASGRIGTRTQRIYEPVEPQSPPRSRRRAPLRAASLDNGPAEPGLAPPVSPEPSPAPATATPSPWTTARVPAAVAVASLAVGLALNRPFLVGWAVVCAVLTVVAYRRASAAPLSAPMVLGPDVISAAAGTAPGTPSARDAASEMPRRIELTTEEVRQVDLGVVTARAALAEIRSVNASVSFANSYRQVLNITTAARDLQLEGDAAQVASLVAAIQASAGVDATEVKPATTFWLARAFVVGVLFTFGVGGLLLAIPTYTDQSAIAGFVCAAVGVGCLTAGWFTRRLLFR